MQGHHLASFVRLAHVEQHALARVMFLTTNDGDHVARLAFERGRNGVTTMIPDLEGGGTVVCERGSGEERGNTYRLDLETEPVAVPPSARNMVFSNAIAASNDSTPRLAAQGAPLRYVRMTITGVWRRGTYRRPTGTRDGTDTFHQPQMYNIGKRDLGKEYGTQDMSPCLTFRGFRSTQK